MVDRLKEDHENAALIALHLSQNKHIDIVVKDVETNLVFFNLKQSSPLTAEQLQAKLLDEHKIMLFAVGPMRIRLVTHLDVSQADCKKVALAIDHLLQ
jgi:threonine aldolase